ncbi:MAG: contractile injection system protein, VgrG/Pvc8 family, partial [Pseudomonadota bacterium]
DLTAELKAPKTREWKDTTVGQLVEAIAAEHDLTPRVAAELASIPIEHLSQTSESDLNLLTRQARRMDAVAKVGGGALLFVRRGAGATASGEALTPIPLGADEVAGWSWRIDDRGTYASAAAFWNDLGGAKRQRVETSAEAPQFEISETFATEAIARRAAAAKLEELRRGGLRMEVALPVGRPELLAETPVDLSGFKDGIDGRWIAQTVSHRFEGSDGFRTALTLVPPPETA